ncbi:DUF3592 domain-containing protein [Streptomyces sp. NPDC005209]|uniref:DUF3592 domain-containing protein n=1 Tax=Streptomyces sp. NPDC005209 TaxID=3156715 RepID=UPI00339DFF42
MRGGRHAALCGHAAGDRGGTAVAAARDADAGVVVDNVRTHDSDGPTWVPVIAFTEHRGYRVEFSPRARGSGMGLATGREVGVVYLSRDPQTARVLMWRHTTGRWCSCSSAASSSWSSLCGSPWRADRVWGGALTGHGWRPRAVCAGPAGWGVRW